MDSLDYRTLTEKVELRTTERGTPKLVGYAARFNSNSLPIGGQFIERISKGAFRDTLAEGHNIRALWNHQGMAQPLGTTRAGTLKLHEDDNGLAFELDLPDTQLGRDMKELVQRGDVAGMSFGFRTQRDTWDRGDESTGKLPTRTLHKVHLAEVSLTDNPYYEATSVAVRSYEAWQMEAAAEIHARMRMKLRLADTV